MFENLWTGCILVSFLVHNVIGQGQTVDDLINQVFNQNGTEDRVAPATPAPLGGIDLQPNTGNNNNDNVGGGGGGIPGTGSCTCVPYYLCNNGSINTNGEGIIDIRINEGPCESYIDVCCDEKDQADEPITPSPPPVKRAGCGYRNPEGIGFRITGDKDNESEYGEFPWMVAILREEGVEGNLEKLNIYQCGGSLIHPSVVLTAAHCVAAKDKRFKIRAGEWDTQTTKELYPHQDREVEKVVIHPQFYKGALYNDIALLFLSSPVTLAKNVDVICLPNEQDIFDRVRCVASGWGKDVFGKEGKYQVILKKIELPVVPRDDCQESLRKTRLGKFFELHRSFICAGGEPNKDTCKGDGGSPLVCTMSSHADQYVQSGIVAWGIGCGEDGTPGVYVNVAIFRSWIEEQLTLNEIHERPFSY